MLNSPGVQVNVIDESFFGSGQPGTIPLVLVATSENKRNSSSTGIAPATTTRNAEKPFLLTSQRDLAEKFGDPLFQTDSNNNPIHASEINEYGLQSAYSFLGVSSRAWVIRANVNLDNLRGTAFEPTSDPAPGTYWLDTAETSWGIFEWNGNPRNVSGGQTFTKKDPIVVTENENLTFGTLNVNGTNSDVPKGSIGTVGDYAIVFASTTIRLFYRNTEGTWVLVGSDQWAASWTTLQGDNANPDFTQPTATFDINNTTIDVLETDTVQDVANKINNALIQGITADVVDGRLNIYSDASSSASEDSSASGEVIISNLSNPLNEELGIEEGNYFPPALQISKHTNVPEFKDVDAVPRPTGSVWIKTTTPGGGANWKMKIFNDQTQSWEKVDTPIYKDNSEALFQIDRSGGGENIPNGAVYIKYNVSADNQPLATFKAYKRNSVRPTTIVGEGLGSNGITSNTYTIQIQATQPGQSNFTKLKDVTFVTNGNKDDAEVFVSKVNSLGIRNLSAGVADDNRVRIEHALGGDIRLVDDSSNPVLNKLGFSKFEDQTTGTRNLYYVDGTGSSTTPLQYQASLWKSTEGDTNGNQIAFYNPQEVPVRSLTEDQELWYNSIIDEVDIMINDGQKWVGYKNFSTNLSDTNPSGPIVQASAPLQQTDGTPLVTGDLWIDTSDIRNYPRILRFDANLPVSRKVDRWIPVDKTDQTSENGIIFDDARWSTSGAESDEPAAIKDLLESNYVDPDAPDPVLYPRGMMLWNLRRSGFNVKRFVRNYIDQSNENVRFNDESMKNYYPHRWVTESRNQPDGSGSFGSNAQRVVVVQAMQAAINGNEEIRDTENHNFNLMASPGYPELIGELNRLNFDRDLTAFIVGDSPARLRPDSNSLQTWATNERGALQDSAKGLVTRTPYLGIFYPWGFTSDNFGNNIAVPPSHMMLRTIALSDQVSFPWFAPAGIRRGGLTNATSVGVVNEEGEFESVTLNEGQRDTLYINDVNPLTFFRNSGLVNFGQKTRSRGESALNRINVARLLIFMRKRLNDIAKPYIFEQNDKITRDEIKQAVETFMIELVGQRALNDFLVVVDESNNTPARIDRNELYVDIAIEPIKSVEFIFIPLRVKNTGEISSQG